MMALRKKREDRIKALNKLKQEKMKNKGNK